MKKAKTMTKTKSSKPKAIKTKKTYEQKLVDYHQAVELVDDLLESMSSAEDSITSATEDLASIENDVREATKILEDVNKAIWPAFAKRQAATMALRS